MGVLGGGIPKWRDGGEKVGGIVGDRHELHHILSLHVRPYSLTQKLLILLQNKGCYKID